MKSIKNVVLVFALFLFSFSHPVFAQTNYTVVCKYDEKLEFKREDAEKRCLGQLPKSASRVGEDLILSLDNVKKLTISSNIKACLEDEVDKCIREQLVGYFPEINSYVLHSTFYEGGQYYLISRQTGAKTTLYGFPVISPHKDFLINIGCDEYAENSELKIYKIDNKNLKEVFNLKNNCLGFTRWRDETSF